MTAGRPDKQFRAARDRLRSELGQGLRDDVGLLPGERDLAARFDISRTTMRRVLAALVAEGVLIQRQGVGTFVAAATSPGSLPASVPPSTLSSGLEGLAATAASRGLTLRSEILSHGEARPLPEEAMLLACRRGEAVHRLRRLRLLDDRPLAVEDAVVPAAFWPAAMEPGASLHLALAQAGLVLAWRLQSVKAAGAEAEEARLLGVAAGDPVIRLRRTEYAATGRCGLFTRTAFRADGFDMLIDLDGSVAPEPPR